MSSGDAGPNLKNPFALRQLLAALYRERDIPCLACQRGYASCRQSDSAETNYAYSFGEGSGPPLEIGSMHASLLFSQWHVKSATKGHLRGRGTAHFDWSSCARNYRKLLSGDMTILFIASCMYFIFSFCCVFDFNIL